MLLFYVLLLTNTHRISQIYQGIVLQLLKWHGMIFFDDTINLEISIDRLISDLSKIEFSQMLSQFDTNKQSNLTYRFMMVYIRMVKRLLTFIEASRSRDWLLHLSAAEDLMQDFISMNRIKYRRMFAAYIADMRYLQTSDPDMEYMIWIWKHFL